MANLEFILGDLLPVFVIGYEGMQLVPPDAPPWLHILDHQYGGDSCQQWVATGNPPRVVSRGSSWPSTHASLFQVAMTPPRFDHRIRDTACTEQLPK
ncbi:MAG: hypothetical protein E6J91_22540 [Deltaproteobacteria bacterium]|nr:MAG: hypothetical protein E6J91_22540 [Deltaproteobacteria bacterium]